MRITLHPRQLQLTRPFRSSGWEITARDVLLLRIDDGYGHVGWGESAPLPVFGTETLDEARAALTAITEVEHTQDAYDLLVELDGQYPELQSTPTARFAMETALRDLISRQRGMSLARQLGSRSTRSTIPVNAVVGEGTPEEAATAAIAAVRSGYRCLKLKVGAEDPEEDLARIRAVRLELPPEALLRLDANGAWDFGTAEEALHLFQPYDIEYIEQPVPAGEFDELAALRELRILPVAADESAQRLEDARGIIARGGADVLVLKPMAMGSLKKTMGLILEAYDAGIDVVCTSLIDSAVGRTAVAQLCAALPFPLRHQGLSTGTLLADDSGRDRIIDGELWLPDGNGLGMEPAGTGGA